jgi:hypothetical protein
MIQHSFALALLLAAGPGAGDVYFEQTVVTWSNGHPDGPGVVSQVWHSGRKMRMEVGGALEGPALILRLDTGKAYRLDPASKTATALDAERLRTRSEMDLGMVGDLMGSDEEGHTAALKTPRTIAGLACRGFRVSAGSTVMDVYVTDRIPLGIDAFTAFLDWSGASRALGGILDQVRKLPGFPLETRTRVTVLGQVHETLSTVTRVKVGPQPASLFEPPADYDLLAEEPEQP